MSNDDVSNKQRVISERRNAFTISKCLIDYMKNICHGLYRIQFLLTMKERGKEDAALQNESLWAQIWIEGIVEDNLLCENTTSMGSVSLIADGSDVYTLQIAADESLAGNIVNVLDDNTHWIMKAFSSCYVDVKFQCKLTLFC
jgi:hypothetical protein